MLFIQKHSVMEYKFGQQTVWFAVSDNYSELYTDIGIETNIFNLDTVKQDLNTDEGSFAIDELGFSINQLSCSNDNDKRALFFCLDATDLKINRYCAVFFGSEPTLGNLLFIGKIDTKVSGDDKVWGCGNYPVNINPKREYKFSALSFDVSVLDSVLLNEDIEKPDGTGNTLSIYNRFRANNWAEIKALFDYRINYSTDYGNYNHSPLGNLYSVVQLFFNKAEDVLYDLYNVRLSFNLLNSDIGITGTPTSYKLNIDTDNKEQWLVDEIKNSDIPIKLILSETETVGINSAVYIHRKMVHPLLGYDESIESVSSNDKNINDIKSLISSEKSYSFANYKNITELLYDIARTFACYVFFTYTDGTNFNIEFKSRKGITEDGFTYIVGSNDASIDISSVLSESTNEYYAVANKYASEGIDSYVIEKWKINDTTQTPPVTELQLIETTEKFKNEEAERKNDEDKKTKKYEKLLFCTASTLVQGQNHTHPVPLNNVSTLQGQTDSWYKPFLYSVDTPYKSWGRERLTSAIYLKTNSFEPKQIERNTGIVYRPVAQILAQIEGENKPFPTLTEYVNAVMARDKHYYETEYSLTVPYWNGFSKNDNGTAPSWKNIKLGSKIKLSEPVIRFINNQWVENIVERDFIVVSIERSLGKPETKLKLHSLERFAFGYWDGSTSDIPGLVFTPLVDGTTADPNTVIADYPYVIDETIHSGDAVSLMPNGEIVKTRSITEHYYCIGVALSNSENELTVKTQIGGRVESNNYNFSNIGGYCFARTTNSGCNITQNGITDDEIRAKSETAIIIMGIIDSPNSFIMNIRSMELL